ncbi:MAG: cytochrome c biogenesis protein ResB, partial [Verrucomicrobiota bacterium]
SSSLPFTLEVSGYQRNSMPIAASAPIAAKTGGPAVDGFRLLPRPPEKEAEANLAGCYVTLTPTAPGEEPQKVLLWAHVGGNFTERVPHTTTVGGKTYGLQIVRERMQTPFTVKLDEFIFEKYGGSGTAKNYQSNITKVEEGSEERIEIKMNEPMRHRGFTFFQASFGPANAGPDEELYTQFAVVKNPSDHWPLASLIITMLGLFFHMGLKLRDHLNRSSSTGRRANA